MWQNWQFFMAKFANFCGKIWQNLGFQMAIFCDASIMSISILTAQRLRHAAGFLAAPPGLFAVTSSATSFHALLRLWFWQLVKLICKIFSRRGNSARRRVKVSSSLQRGCLLGLATSILGNRQM